MARGATSVSERHVHLARHPAPVGPRAQRTEHPLQQRVGRGNAAAPALDLLDERVIQHPLDLLGGIDGSRDRLGDRSRQAAELQIQRERISERRAVKASLVQLRFPVECADIGDRQARRGWYRAVDGSRKRGKRLWKHEIVAARPAPSRESLGRSLLQVDSRGTGAHNNVITDRPVVPEGLHRGLPAGYPGHLVEQHDARPPVPRENLCAADRLRQLGVVLSLDEIERQVHDRARLVSLGQGSLHQQLQVGALADLSRTAQRVNGRPSQVDRADELCR